MTKQILDMLIERRRLLPGGMWHMTFVRADGADFPAVEPGQFAQIQVDGAMLRRPISISDAPTARELSMLVKPVGAGTRSLTSKAEGERVNMVLPLGRPFTPALPGERVLLAGGGVGAAPLVLLAHRLKALGADVTVALGGRSVSDIEGLPELYGDVRVAVATDDGTLGHHGLVTTLPEMSEAYDRIYCCGPTPMMKAVAAMARARGIRCEVSLENMMACGLGACLCCVEKTVRGNVCVCTEGPVFNINELTWQ